jgi:hypothetical protein
MCTPMEIRSRRITSLSLSSGLHATLLAVLVFGSLKGLSETTPGEHVVGVVTLPSEPRPTVADVIAENQQLDEAHRNDDALGIPGLEIDISRIRARQHELFPLLTEGLPELVSAQRRTVSGREALIWFTPSLPGESGSPPLLLTDAELNRIVDDAWSRRERWQSFVEIATLVSAHDPDVGRAVDLVRAHVDRNLLQPYNRRHPPDEQFWLMLYLAVDQAPIIRFVEGFVREHPGSRVATELLFLLEELTEANLATLVMLAVADPASELTLTRDLDPEAYELVLEIHRHYGGLLRSRQLDSPARIHGLYDDIRIHLLTTILEMTPDGYGAADARYLLGRIYWNQNRFAEAMDWWRGIQPDTRGMYASVYSRIVPAVVAPSTTTNARINAALGAARLAWRRSSTARLEQFGHTPGDF